jgi:superfamily II DNA or RNA helicase
MAKRQPTFDFVNLRGEPVTIMPPRLPQPAAAPPKRAPQPAAAAPPAVSSLAPAEIEQVFDALCLAGTRRSSTWVAHLMLALRWPRADGSEFTARAVEQAWQTLAAAGRLQQRGNVNAGGTPLPALLSSRWRELMARPEAATYWRAWAWVAGNHKGQPDGSLRSLWLSNDDERVVLLRLVLASGMAAAEYHRIAMHVLGSAVSPALLLRAFGEPLDSDLFERMQPDLRWALLTYLDQTVLLKPAAPALCQWLEAAVSQAPADVPAALRLRVAGWRLHRGEFEGMRQALEGSEACVPFVPVFEACALAWQGRWAEAARASAPALKILAQATGRRIQVVPASTLELLLLAHLAQPDPGAWAAARRMAVAESRSRQPPPRGWGLWAHALAVRLGEQTAQPAAFEAPSAGLADPDTLILAAWLNLRPKRWTTRLVENCRVALVAQGLPWKAELLRQAGARLGLGATDAPGADWPVVFYGEAPEAWRDALAAIGALAPQRSAVAAPATLQWRLKVNALGRVVGVSAFERTLGARGLGKPKLVGPARLAKNSTLDPRDAAVARHIVATPWSARDFALDLDAMAGALVGHPGVVFDEAPDVAVELVESLPTLEVERERQRDGSERWRFRVDESLQGDGNDDEDEDDDYDSGYSPGRPRIQALPARNVRVLRESPTRARLVRITPAQTQVAELVARGWTVPLEAQQELDAALRVLAGHFLLHSDALGGQTVAADPLLRAQFTPRGDALELRLVVRPFGSFGPTMPPTTGRARLHTLHEGASLATERDLAAERAHLQSVSEALPFLGEAAADASWLLEDPEQALAAVEQLGTLPAVAAIEWPRGQPMTVLQPPSQALQLRVASGRDWFELDGELQVDAGRVLGLKQLLTLLDGARSQRYVALGEGRYLALTQSLRRRLDELAALGNDSPTGLRLPGAAAAWLAEAADTLNASGDGAWEQRAQRLEQAASLAPAAPAALQAQLRGYQLEGYTWMLRLAHAGFGALLADDMGLGKTVQTLAMLLARAEAGPALVVAPTSVCGNWLAEGLRFAPSLTLHDHGSSGNSGSSDATATLAPHGAGDVVVVSYALLLRDAEAFAAKPWATLVLDEAQALKNAATKRAQAVGALQADFRLALTGTPVENRLSDLWSIMNLLNPGLLGNANRFAERFANPIERLRDDAARGRLRRIVAPFLLRRTKAQVLAELPPRTEIVLRIEPGNDERAFLEAARQRAVERVAAVEGPQAAFHVLAELTRLRRAACDPRLVAPELSLPGAKVLEFERLAGELVAGGHQALVFSQFTDFLKLLAERLDSAGIGYQYLDGSTPATTRTERVAAFQRGASPLFLISLKAGGFGLNLTAADYVIIADPWWNPAAEDQASGRAHRLGQQRPVTVYRLVTAGSIEERIVDLHGDKRALAEGLLAGQDGGAPLAAAELLSLLRG